MIQRKITGKALPALVVGTFFFLGCQMQPSEDVEDGRVYQVNEVNGPEFFSDKVHITLAASREFAGLYMRYNGGEIKGDVTAKGYDGWINLHNMQFGPSELTVVKGLDSASRLLLKAAVTGSKAAKVEIAVVRTDSNSLEEFGRYIMEDALISSYSINDSPGDSAVSEHLSLSYSKITFASHR